MQRPLFPRINRRASLGGGLLFAALGGGASTSMCGDSSGFGNNCAMTAVDHTNWAIDPYLSRRKVTYDGSAEYVDLGTVTRSWFLGLPSFAFSSWVRTTQTERASLLGSYNSLTAPFYSVEINRGASIPDSGKLFIISRRTTTLTDLTGYSTADTMINDGNWHHLSVNVGLLANTISVFLDGVAVPITYVAQDYGAVGVTTVRNLFLAGLNNAGSLAVPFAGSLSDVLIHGRAITLPEIQILTKPDPWLGGLILQPTRKLWPVATTETPPAVTYRPMQFQVC